MTPTDLHELLRNGAWVDLVASARALRAEVDDDTPRVEALLARAWVRLGQPDDATQAADAAHAKSHLAEVGLAFGEARLAAGEPGQARAILDTVREACEDDSVIAHEVDLARATVLCAAGEGERGYGLALRRLELARSMTDARCEEEALVVVGQTAWTSGMLSEAVGAYTRALQARRTREAAPVLLAETLDGLGICARHAGHPFEAVKHHEQALELWVAGAGEDSGPVSACRHRLAQALHRTGDFRAAYDEMARALLATGATLGRDHVDTWITRFELARYQVDCGQPEVGLQKMVAARTEVATRLGDTHPVVRTMDRYL